MYFRNIVFIAVVVGLLVGIFTATYRIMALDSVIFDAEVYEVSEPVQSEHHYDGETQAHHHDADAWGPENGLERTFYTYVTNILVSIGFALIMASMMAFRGENLNTATGLLWGLAGFLSFFVVPAMLGLHPEIPGTNAAVLESRQAWWLLAVACTAVGLALLAFGNVTLKVVSIIILALPHVIGAPLPEAHGFANTDPEAVMALTELSHEFFRGTAMFNGLNWLLIGCGCGYAVKKFIIQTNSQAQEA